MPARRRRGCLARISGRALRRTLAAARLCRRELSGLAARASALGPVPGSLSWDAAACASLRRSPSLRGPNGEGRRRRKRKARPRCPRTAGRSPQCAARGVNAAWEKKARTRDGGDLNVPCAYLAKRARQEPSSRRTVPSHEGKRFSSRQVRRRPHKSVRANRSAREPDVPSNGRNLTCPAAENQLHERNAHEFASRIARLFPARAR